jgi:hypothetical protein
MYLFNEVPQNSAQNTQKHFALLALAGFELTTCGSKGRCKDHCTENENRVFLNRVAS